MLIWNFGIISKYQFNKTHLHNKFILYKLKKKSLNRVKMYSIKVECVTDEYRFFNALYSTHFFINYNFKLSFQVFIYEYIVARI